MFRRLTDFGYPRTFQEAVGFYLAYFILLIAVAILAAGIYRLVDSSAGWREGARVGNLIATVTCLGLSFLILRAKAGGASFLYILLTVVSGILALFVGGLGGLVPVAYLSTRPNLSRGVSQSEDIHVSDSHR